RGFHVTGVQTCALPIFHPARGRPYEWARRRPIAAAPAWLVEMLVDRPAPRPAPRRAVDMDDARRYRRASAYIGKMPPAISGQGDIGSAAWRERGTVRYV